MAINPPSDLVLDVARAADPQTYKMSAARLQSSAPSSHSGQSGFAGASFSSLSNSIAPTKVGVTEINPAYRKFEAFMLQSFVQSMFTSDTQTVFGKGISGEYWKSMMAEAMAEKMADGNGIGIARMLSAEQARAERTDPMTLALAFVTSDLENTGDAEALSRDIVHGFERQLIQQQLEKSSGREEPKQS